jgi:hypothetical protein
MLARVLCILAALLLCAPVHADDAADKAKDIAQMKKIWEAIQAYKKAKGDVPKFLSDLVPDYLPDKKILVSPRGPEGMLSNQSTADPNLPCTYAYDFIGEGKNSLKEVRKKQMEEYGDIVPILRCFIYGKVISISYGGEVFETIYLWEKTDFAKAWLAKRNIEPGSKNGEKLVIIVVDKDGKPIPAVTINASERTTGTFELPDLSLTTGPDGTAALFVAKTEDAGAKLSFQKAGIATLPRFWPVRDDDGNIEPAEKYWCRWTLGDQRGPFRRRLQTHGQSPFPPVFSSKTWRKRDAWSRSSAFWQRHHHAPSALLHHGLSDHRRQTDRWRHGLDGGHQRLSARHRRHQCGWFF